MKREDITGILLAGGKSSRMGRDKGMALLHGHPMASHILRTLRKITPHILIVANNDNYNGFGYPVVRDIIRDCGPLGGIYTGLLHSETPFSLVVSCDIPFVSADILHTLAVAPSKYEVCVPVSENHREPLCARYSRSCALHFSQLLSGNKLKMQEAINAFSIMEIDLNSIPGFDPVQIANINTPAELSAYNQEVI